MIHRKLQPSSDHILIQYADAMRADVVESNPQPDSRSAARIIAVGPGRTGADGNTIPLGLKVGECVYVNGTRGVRIRLNRQSYAVVRKRDLVGLR
jgi:co-chaperonin GroES (HSP10)